MKDLKGSINRDSDHYKSLKDGLLSSRREYISEKKQLVTFRAKSLETVVPQSQICLLDT